MYDQDLRLTSTHGSEEHSGTALGVEVRQFWWLALGVLAGLALLVGLSARFGFVSAAPWAAAPVAVVLFFLRSQRGKTPGHALDLMDQLLTGGHARPPMPSTSPEHDDTAS